MVTPVGGGGGVVMNLVYILSTFEALYKNSRATLEHNVQYRDTFYNLNDTSTLKKHR